VDLHYDLDDNRDNRQFYWDQRTAGGADRDSRHGLETANVIFNVGHGGLNPRYPDDDVLNILGPEDVFLSKVRLGDGAARYLLLASCLVMSHGPQECTPPTLFYGCPQDYQPHTGQRNVFVRWQSRIAPGLRMACAGSTLLFPDEGLSERFWQYYRVQSLPVADAVLLALAKENEVPLCITHGSRVPATTPLFDRRFTATRNRRALFGKGRFLHAMYPVHDSPSAKALEAALLSALRVSPRDKTNIPPPPPPAWLPPILVHDPEGDRRSDLLESFPSLPPDFLLLPFGFRQVPDRVLAKLGKAARGLSVQVHPGSGAVILRWSPHPLTALAKALNPLGRLKLGKVELFERARTALTAKPAVSSFVLRIDRVRRRVAEADVPECFEACRYVRLQKWVSLPVPGEPNIEAPMIGPGSEWVLASCPSGSGRTGGTGGGACPAAGRDEMVLTFDLRSAGQPRSHKDIDGIVLPVDPVDHARKRARLELQQRGYDTEGPAEKRVIEQGPPQIAYEAPPIHCTQKLLFPFLRFTYNEVEPRHGTEPHEIVIEVPYYLEANGLGADGRTTQNRTCSPELPAG
jgi:hypothetical protein